MNGPLHSQGAWKRLRRTLAAAWLVLGSACGGGGGGSDAPLDGPPFTVSGTMLATSGSAVDSDVNDPSAPYAANDSALTAQEIPNPVTLGGHVNVAGAKPAGAPDGRTTATGDPEDWFRVAIAVNQRLRLAIAEDGGTNDLDLELRRLDGTLVASSRTGTRTEEITVAASDEYLVVVIADSGFSNYTLTIGQSPTAAGATPPPTAEFMLGEVIVRYRDRLPAAVAAMTAPARAASFGMRHEAGRPDGPMLFACRTFEEREAAFRALGLKDSPRLRRVAPSAAPDGAPAGVEAEEALRDEEALREDTLRLVEALRRQPDVRSADLNYVRRPSAVPDDEFYSFQWHYDQINLPQAWEAVSRDSGVIVALVDTGVKTGHPDLGGQLLAGYDFITDVATSNDGDGCDADPDDPGDLAPGGSSFHGTHVAGTLAARTSLQLAGNTDGVAGVAWNARIMPLRVLGVGGGTDMDIMAALRYAARLDNACGTVPPQKARIVNLSLGGPGFNQAFQDLVTELRDDHDMIFVAAAGNDASSAPIYPAAYAGVISVSSVGPTKALAPYSNFGSSIDVAAPGGDFARDVDGDGFPDGVLSTFFDDSNGDYAYAFYQGTSMATPHVAGVIALMLGIEPTLLPADIDNALNLGEITEDIGSSEFFGNGLIDAVKAVNRADAGGGGGVLQPVLRVDPDALNYGFLADSFVVTASNGGNDAAALEVLGVTFTSDDGAPWLTLTPESVDGAGLGSYRADVDRSALADGLYTGTIQFDSDANDIDVPVIMQVGDVVSLQANAGHHFVLLVRPGTLETVAMAEADVSDGVYRFRFEDVDEGEYLLIAGTDSDNDDLICDAGEACGAFPTTETIVPLSVSSHRSVQFVTGFSSNVSSSIAGANAEAGSGGGFSRRLGGRPGNAR